MPSPGPSHVSVPPGGRVNPVPLIKFAPVFSLVFKAVAASTLFFFSASQVLALDRPGRGRQRHPRLFRLRGPGQPGATGFAGRPGFGCRAHPVHRGISRITGFARWSATTLAVELVMRREGIGRYIPLSSVPEIRVHAVNEAPVRGDGDYVLYWMIAATGAVEFRPGSRGGMEPCGCASPS